MKILLAPMDGLTDPLMREILTSIGGYDYAATEFVRVTQRVLPDHVFYKYSPELKQGGMTKSGVPVFIQLLGGNPELMAENAVRACALGAPGIDINFGCPAKKVNSHDGGSVILNEPQRVYDISNAVRQAVPAETPVTVKIRLGYLDESLAIENSLAAQEAGAHWLSVHARTKIQGYKPPANWKKLAEIKSALQIPLIANGEIWSTEDWQRCKDISGCNHVMLGRGAVANPFLARSISSKNSKPLSWKKTQPLWEKFFEESLSEQYCCGRAKQWLKLLSRRFLEAERVFEVAKRYKKPSEIQKALVDSFQPPLTKPANCGFLGLSLGDT